MLLENYNAEVGRLAELASANPLELVCHPSADPENDSIPWTWTQAEDCRYRLRQISVEVRRALWNGSCREFAREIAQRADDEASRIETENNLSSTGPLPRFEAVNVGGIWSPAVK